MKRLRVGVALTLLASLAVFAAAAASGENWSPLGEGMNGDVYALAFGSSGELYAGGGFTSAGGGPANHVAEWNGSAWIPLGGGLSAEVYALATDNQGNLYAGGSFASAGDVTVNRVAKWNGTAWTALGSGMNADVYALAVSGKRELIRRGHFHQRRWHNRQPDCQMGRHCLVGSGRRDERQG